MRRNRFFSGRLKEFCLSVAVMLGTGLPAFAQTDGKTLGKTLLKESAEGIKGLATDLVTLLQVVLGIVGLVVLAMVISKLMKGDREAAEKLGMWIGGITIGFVLLTVLKSAVLT